jgi:hypothetical protein
MKRFIFDSILDEENICNLEKEKHKIMKGVDNGLKLIWGVKSTFDLHKILPKVKRRLVP